MRTLLFKECPGFSRSASKCSLRLLSRDTRSFDLGNLRHLFISFPHLIVIDSLDNLGSRGELQRRGGTNLKSVLHADEVKEK
jgi:hypothetical protein